MTYLSTREQTPIELMLHEEIEGKGIQDEEACKEWFKAEIVAKLRTPEVLDSPLILNIVYLMVEDHLDWKLIFTGNIDSEIVIEM